LSGKTAVLVAEYNLWRENNLGGISHVPPEGKGMHGLSLEIIIIQATQVTLLNIELGSR
jgi:hypothetical protein